MELTKHLEDEQQLHLLNTILSAAEEYVYLFDQNGRYLFVSENATMLFGLQQRDFLGKTWQEIGLPEEFTEPFEVNLRKVIATGRAVTEEIFYPVSTGMRWFEYIAKPVVDGDGEVTAIVVSSRDITERKQAADTLHRLASIVESSGEAILSKTLEGVITSWNSSAEKLYGYRAEEAIGQSVSLIFPQDHQQEFREILAQVARGRTLRNYETTRVRKDGTHIEVSATISPIPDHTGRIIGASTIAHDITEHKRLAEELAARRHQLERSNKELRQQRDQLTAVNLALEEANQARSQFLSTMSHELRTPLASIIGFAQMVLEDAVSAGFDLVHQKNLERILKNAQHLLDLINDVLDLSKIEAGRMDVTYGLVNVKQLLTSVIEETQSMAQHLVVKAEVEEGIDSLETNPMKLHQILLNLVSNALKFTRQGEVIISARRVKHPDKEGEHMALSVTDTGIGIPMDMQERIFEAFYQVDGSYKRKFGGTGLGLAIVRQLTTLLGGTVQVTSAPGQGSTFTVLLPMRAAQYPVEQYSLRLHSAHQTISPSADESTPNVPCELVSETVSREVSGGQNNVVLVVDDNPDIVVLVQAAFKDTPYTVVGVTDPLQVMESIQELRPCAIMLDVMMPGLNGWQVLHRLKDNTATASIPVVMLTVLSEPGTGYLLGADDYLIKPFKQEALLSTLDRLVALRQSSFPHGRGERWPVER